MTFKPLIVSVLMAIAVICSAIFVPFAWADNSNNQSNQSLNQPSVLVAPEPDFKINVYPKPGTDRQRVGYGLGGDRVTVLEQAGSNEGYLWNYVQFSDSPMLKGWIREEFVASDTQKIRQPQNSSNQHRGQGSRLQTDLGYWSDRQSQRQGNQRQERSSQYPDH